MKILHDHIMELLQKIADKTGIRVESIDVDWLDTVEFKPIVRKVDILVGKEYA